MSPSEQPKKCAACGADVTHTERMKDAKGRYICAPCIAKLKAEKRGGGGGAAATTAASAGASVGESGGGDQGADLREYMRQAKEAAKNQCPSCGSFAQPGAIICLNCGYDARTQSQLQTKFGTAKASKSGGVGGGGLGISLPESGTVVGAIAFVYFLFAVVLPIVDVFQLKMGLIMISFSIVFLMSFVLWIVAIIALMRRMETTFGKFMIFMVTATFLPLSAIMAMVYGAFYTESRALRWFSISNMLGFATCVGLGIYLAVTEAQ